jgi:hypothetical protein
LHYYALNSRLLRAYFERLLRLIRAAFPPSIKFAKSKSGDNPRINQIDKPSGDPAA